MGVCVCERETPQCLRVQAHLASTCFWGGEGSRTFVGLVEGERVGTLEGGEVGGFVGIVLGWREGAWLGASVGSLVGFADGDSVGV